MIQQEKTIKSFKTYDRRSGSIREILPRDNFLRRDLIRYRLAADLKPLAKDVPADSELFLLLRNDVNKRISQLSSVNSALEKKSKENSYYSNREYYNKDKHRNFGKYSYKNNKISKNFKAPQRSSAQGNKGCRQTNYWNKR